jgi:8-oxo-dGTP pyrophosphatase MutT (NUDIX family)
MQDIGNINHKLVQKPTGGYTLAETDITPSDNTRVVTPSLSAFTTQRPEIREASAEGFTPFGTM